MPLCRLGDDLCSFQHKVGLLSLQGGQHDLPVHGGPEQLRWVVGYGAVPLEDVPADDDAHAAKARDAGGVQTAVHRLLQPPRPAAEGRGGGHSPAVGRHPHLGQRYEADDNQGPNGVWELLRMNVGMCNQPNPHLLSPDHKADFSFEDLLTFITGADHLHPLGLSSQIYLRFYSQVRHFLVPLCKVLRFSTALSENQW